MIPLIWRISRRFLFFKMAVFPNFLQSFFNSPNLAKDAREERQEGVVGSQKGVLSLERTDAELIDLKNKWEAAWNSSEVFKRIQQKQEENEKYWRGDHFTPAQRATKVREAVDNAIFEALETALPQFTKQIAEPYVEPIAQFENDPQAMQFARDIQDKLVNWADEVRLRLKVKKSTRHWALYFLGVLKFGWLASENRRWVEVVRPQQLIFDPDAMTGECEYVGDYLGHYRVESASTLLDKFGEPVGEVAEGEEAPDTTIRRAIIGAAGGEDKLGTKLRYVEWWTPEMVFWTLKDTVLGKNQNPHWNYDSQVESINEIGEPIVMPVRGINHFASPKIPFAFISIFNLGKGPYDDTNLIEQVLPIQDIINKRNRQIDRNADNTNNGIAISGEVFDKEQAKQVVDARRRGQAIFIPKPANGDIRSSILDLPGNPLPEFIFADLQDKRGELRNVFGTTGLSAEGLKKTETVRGKILVKGSDTDRAAIVVDHIEQFYDYVFNWFVQLEMVYGDQTQFAFPLVVSVKEGSLIPKDRLTLRNEAIDLWTANAISPIELYERLEFPDPQESARKLMTWQLIQRGVLTPDALFQDQTTIVPTQSVEQKQGASLLNAVPIQ